MRKFTINVGLIVVVIFLVALNIFTFMYWKKVNTRTAEQYTSQIANMEATIAGYGNEVTCYTVKSSVKAGDEITEDNIEPLTMYSSLVNDQYVTDISEIVGQFFKIAVNPGTPIFYNSIMSENIDDTVRDRDICLDRLTVGLEVGDYIDVRITMPYGDDYVILSHKRVYGINENSVKLYLTELEWNRYVGALVDYLLNAEYGCAIYGDKYVEPGIQQAAVEFYAVPSNIAALLQKNPNIVDKEEASSLNEWRSSLEELLVIFRDEEDTVDSDGSKLSAGRSTYNTNIETDRKALAEAKAEAEAEAAEQQQNDEEAVGDDYWDDTPTDTDTTTTDTDTTTTDTNNTEATTGTEVTN